MLIGGLWHGANWTFVVWGAYHGLLLVLYRFGGFAWDRLPGLVRQVLFFVLVVIGWVFFRADQHDHGMALLRAMFPADPGSLGAKSATIFAVATLLAGLWACSAPMRLTCFATSGGKRGISTPWPPRWERAWRFWPADARRRSCTSSFERTRGLRCVAGRSD